jgi:hypothetical protein
LEGKEASKQAKKGRNKASLKERKVGAKEQRWDESSRIEDRNERTNLEGTNERTWKEGRKELGRTGVGAGSV